MARENSENPRESMCRSCEHLLSAYIGRWRLFFRWTAEGLHFWATCTNHLRTVMSFFFFRSQLRAQDLRWTFFNALTLGQGWPPSFKTWTCLFLVLIFHVFHEKPEVVVAMTLNDMFICCGFAMTRHVRKRGHRSFGELFVGVHSVAGRFAECSSHLCVQHAWLVGSTGTLLPCLWT